MGRSQTFCIKCNHGFHDCSDAALAKNVTMMARQGQEKLHVLIKKNNTEPETSLRIHVGVDAKLLHFNDCHEIMSR